MIFLSGILFDNWTSLFDIIVKGSIIYLLLVVFNRISGKRTLGQMNSFDFVINVAIGSIAGTVVMSSENVIAEGAVAIFLFIFLQFIISWGGVRSTLFKRLIKFEPSVLFYRNQFMDVAMKRERITKSDIFHSIRNQGILDLDTVEAVVLETNGSLSVIRKAEKVESSTLQNIDF